MAFNQLFKTFPVIKTDRLLLRELRETDAPHLFTYYKEKEVHQYLDWFGPESEEKARVVIKNWLRGYQESWIIRWAIVDKATDRLVGTILLSEFFGTRAEIGYELDRAYSFCI